MSGDLTITSPSYPSPYPPSKLCVWHVTTSAAKILFITFPTFRVRCGDFVAVFDGGEGSTELIEAFCNSQDGRGMRTTSNQMTVVFKSNGRRNDMGFTATITEVDPWLVKLASPVTFNDYIMPACLPASSDVLPPRTMVSVSGWGITSYGGATARYLQQMVVPVVSDANCLLLWGSSVDISVDMCAGYVVQGGIDSCSGDSGGPLASRSPTTGAWVLHGAVSRGVPCANPYQPSIYARVTGLVDWLTTTMAEN
ncbi:TMPRSS15 [Branchiostoma lanceolatum]|uniref:TMPRSS15 protein n=1 Tax=Branchiostoma lanceolatum TaxID=7740 RepID=A0A8K0F3U5_BRALA|nr:TMPRSS15 [Branchiostoma lanceolatum]